MRTSSRSVTMLLAAAASFAVLAGCAGEAPASYSAFLTATEFTAGHNRVPFVMGDVNGVLLEEATVSARFTRLLGGGAEEPVAEAPAVWRRAEGGTPHRHPDGALHTHFDVRGYYTVDTVTLNVPGNYLMRLEAANAQGRAVLVEEAAFAVGLAPRALAVGAPAPPNRNRTLADAPFIELSSRAVETDPLHGFSVAEALDHGSPFVVTFASPAFCVSALCGPVVDEMAAAHEALGGSVAFIHIEPWVLSIVREEGRLVLAPEAAEWQLPTEPWTFVVGADGRIAARFEGLVNRDEVLAALAALPGG